jgi:hypothetical protein
LSPGREFISRSIFLDGFVERQRTLESLQSRAGKENRATIFATLGCCRVRWISRTKQARLEARARIDIRKLYEKGQITLKDHASAAGYLRGVWFDHLSDFEIEDFICRVIRKLEPSIIQPAE